MLQQQFMLQQLAPVSRQIPVPPEPAVVRMGRTPDNQIIIEDDTASRHHATLWGASGEVFIRDEQSTNGVVVDGQCIPAQIPYPLRVGSEIRVGNATFVLALSAQPMPESSSQTLPNRGQPPSATWIIAGAAGLATLVLLALLAGSRQTSYPATLMPAHPTTAVPIVTLTATLLPPTVTPTTTPAPTSSAVEPKQSATPSVPFVQSLQETLKQAKKHIEAYGSTIDAAGGKQPGCAAIVADYDAVASAPRLEPPPGQTDLAGLCAEYRKAADLFLVTGHDLYLTCQKFLDTHAGDFSGIQVGQARQGVADAMAILDPALDQAMKLP